MHGAFLSLCFCLYNHIFCWNKITQLSCIWAGVTDVVNANTHQTNSWWITHIFFKVKMTKITTTTPRLQIAGIYLSNVFMVLISFRVPHRDYGSLNRFENKKKSKRKQNERKQNKNIAAVPFLFQLHTHCTHKSC